MRFVVDPDASVVEIDARSTLHPIHGRATGLAGSLDLVEDDHGWSIAAGERSWLSVPVERLTSGNPLEDGELHRRIDSGRYPEITGIVTHAVGADRGTVRVTGDLTFHGITRSVTGELHLAVTGGTARVSGEQTFDVRDYGVDPPKVLMLKVHPQVRVRLSMTARHEEVGHA